jgi:hypothetical protein
MIRDDLLSTRTFRNKEPTMTARNPWDFTTPLDASALGAMAWAPPQLPLFPPPRVDDDAGARQPFADRGLPVSGLEMSLPVVGLHPQTDMAGDDGPGTGNSTGRPQIPDDLFARAALRQSWANFHGNRPPPSGLNSWAAGRVRGVRDTLDTLTNVAASFAEQAANAPRYTVPSDSDDPGARVARRRQEQVSQFTANRQATTDSRAAELASYIREANRAANEQYDAQYGNDGRAQIGRFIGHAASTWFPAAKAAQAAGWALRPLESLPAAQWLSKAAPIVPRMVKSGVEGGTAGVTSAALTSSAHNDSFFDQVAKGMLFGGGVGLVAPAAVDGWRAVARAHAAWQAARQGARSTAGDAARSPGPVAGWLGQESSPLTEEEIGALRDLTADGIRALYEHYLAHGSHDPTGNKP